MLTYRIFSNKQVSVIFFMEAHSIYFGNKIQIHLLSRLIIHEKAIGKSKIKNSKNQKKLNQIQISASII